MVNRTIIQGRLVRDPELNKTQSDVAYTEVTVAWSETYKDVETKCFLPVQAWRHNAEFLCKYFGKGKEIVVEGRLKTSEWTDKDGNKRRTAEVVADNVYFGDSRRDNEGAGAPYAAGSYGGNPYAAPAAPAFGGYSAPSAPASDFAMLDDDDAQLPF